MIHITFVTCVCVIYELKETYNIKMYFILPNLVVFYLHTVMEDSVCGLASKKNIELRFW